MARYVIKADNNKRTYKSYLNESLELSLFTQTRLLINDK